jgi:hypothetical protein
LYFLIFPSHFIFFFLSHIIFPPQLDNIYLPPSTWNNLRFPNTGGWGMWVPRYIPLAAYQYQVW